MKQIIVIGGGAAGHCEDTFHKLRRDYLGRLTVCEDLPVLHKDKVGGIPERKMQIVQHSNDSCTRALQTLGKTKYLQLMIEIEIRRRFIEQQDLRRLRQSHRNPNGRV